VAYHGEHNATPDGRGDLEARLLEHFQRSPGIPFEIEELALQFSSSESHVRRLVKRLWRQGHITEERREVNANNGRGGKSRKKVFLCPPLDDQVTKTQAGLGVLSPDHELPKDDQVTKSLLNQGSLSPDHQIAHTADTNFSFCAPDGDDQVLQTQTGRSTEAPDHDSSEDDQVLPAKVQQELKAPDHSIPGTGDQAVNPSMVLKMGDRVEILTGYFSGRHVDVVGFPPEQPG
jgi:hypothetical protein